MLKKVLIAFVSTGFLATAAIAQAEVKVGYVSTERLLKESPPADKALKKLEKEFGKREQELQKMANQIKTNKEYLEKNAPTMTESDLRNKDREFGELTREFQRKQRDFNEEINLRRNEEVALVYESINKVIRKMAETEKFDLIVQEAVYFSPKIDITDKVIKALGDGSK